MFSSVIDFFFTIPLGCLRIDLLTDLKGDVKIGDFGLASMRGSIKEGDDGTDDGASMSAVSVSKNGDLTNGAFGLLSHWQCLANMKLLGVGTTLYIAPEILHRKSGQDHSKADMYSLGVRASLCARLLSCAQSPHFFRSSSLK